MSIEEWDRMIAIHLRSVFLVTRLVLPMMYRQNSGKIINTASQLAYKASPGLSHCKGGYRRLHALSCPRDRCAQRQCQLRGPGATRTPLTADISEELMGNIRRSIPKGRI